jgi:hypothetical protein
MDKVPEYVKQVGMLPLAFINLLVLTLLGSMVVVINTLMFPLSLIRFAIFKRSRGHVKLEAVPPIDAVYLTGDVRNPTTINAVCEFDSTMDVESLRTIFTDRVLSLEGRNINRLKERIVETPRGFYFEEVGNWSINDHITADVTPINTKDDLTRYLNDYITNGLDYSKPLWSAVLLTNYCDGRSALIFRIHHVLGDGRSYIICIYLYNIKYLLVITQSLYSYVFCILLRGWSCANHSSQPG